MTVVGVVSDIRHFGPKAPPRPDLHGTQSSWGSAVVVRTAVDPLSIVPAVRREIVAMDPAQPIRRQHHGAASGALVSEPRFMSSIVMAFARWRAAAALGIYATLAFAVTQARARSAFGSRSGHSRVR
jgi:hypothetical protein